MTVPGEAGTHGGRLAGSEPLAKSAGTRVVRLWRLDNAVRITIETQVDDSNDRSEVQVFADLDDAVAAIGTFLEDQWRRMPPD